MQWTIYSIELDRGAGHDTSAKGVRYVGSTAHSARCRDHTHHTRARMANPRTWPRCICEVAPGRRIKPTGTPLVARYGRALDRAHTYTLDLPSRDEAWAEEEALATRLQQQGFEVHTDQRGAHRGMVPFRRNRRHARPPLAERAGLPELARWISHHVVELREAWWLGAGVIDYASGSNQPGEIEGLALLRRPVGVSAPECGPACEGALLRLSGTGIPIFVDSGAFSEVRFEDGKARVVHPITAKDWDRRLTFYERLGAFLGPQLTVVAPDQVGSQQGTLERLRAYRARLVALVELGVRVVVPLQVGALSLADFDTAVRAELGDFYVPGIPANKGPAGQAALLAFLLRRRPGAVHLLGMGLRSPRANEMLHAIRDALPEIAISMDSNKVRAVTGSTGGSGGGARPLTEAEGEFDTGVLDAAAGLSRSFDDEGQPIYEEEDACGAPGEWMSDAETRAFCAGLGLSGDERRACELDIDAFLDEPSDVARSGTWATHPDVERVCAQMYRAYVARRTSRSRRRGAVVASLSPGAASAPASALAPHLVLVRAQLADANAYVTERHYLGRGRTMAQVAYWLLWTTERADLRDLHDQPAVRAPKGEMWTVGGIPIDGEIHFALPRVSKRLYGYHPMQLLELARLYLEPGADGRNVANRASQAIGAGVRAVLRDWSDKYPELPAPQGIVSWADTSRHEGTIYRAAGFVDIGRTEGGHTSAPGRAQRSGTRSTVRHADLDTPKQAFVLPINPPGKPVYYVLRFELGGVTRQGAQDLCEFMWAHGQALGLKLPGMRRACVFDAALGLTELVLPLDELDADAPAAGDILRALNERFVEAAGMVEYDQDAWWSVQLERVTPATYQRLSGSWRLVSAERVDELDALANPRTRVLPVLPPASRRALYTFVRGGPTAMAAPYPAPVRWLLEHGLVREQDCVGAAQTVYDRDTCVLRVTRAGSDAWAAVQAADRVELARRQVALFNPQLPGGASWLL